MSITHILSRPATLVRRPVRLYSFARRQPRLATLIRTVRGERLTYIPPEGLIDLSDAVIDIEQREVPGAIVEAGAALGGSAIVLAAAKAPGRPMRVYDTFGMIPPPSSRDGSDVHNRYEEIISGKSRGIGGEVYYAYRDDLLSEVQGNFARYNLPPEHNSIGLIQGRYEHTLTIDYPVALAHLDCDWYESVRICLERIHPYLVSGGRFIIDDYDSWSGCTDAVDEFLGSHEQYRTARKTRLHLVKQ